MLGVASDGGNGVCKPEQVWDEKIKTCGKLDPMKWKFYKTHAEEALQRLAALKKIKITSF